MNSQQYEELCRFFLSRVLGVEPNQIRSCTIPNPTHSDLPEYKHQIDLYWETSNEVTLYINIANAKWRSSDKIDQGEMLLLQKVRDDIHAHKAMMITNIGFTQGAKAVAENQKIALHIVKPTFNYVTLHSSDRSKMLTQFCQVEKQLSRPIYCHEIVCRAFDGSSSMQSTEKMPREDRVLKRRLQIKRIIPSSPCPRSSQQPIQRISSASDIGSKPHTIRRINNHTNQQFRKPQNPLKK